MALNSIDITAIKDHHIVLTSYIHKSKEIEQSVVLKSCWSIFSGKFKEVDKLIIEGRPLQNAGLSITGLDLFRQKSGNTYSPFT